MRKYLVAGIALLGLTGTANAQMYCSTFGALQHCNGPGGYHSEQRQFGPLTNGFDNRGNSWTTQRFGNQTNTIFNH